MADNKCDNLMTFMGTMSILLEQLGNGLVRLWEKMANHNFGKFFACKNETNPICGC